MIGFTGTSLQLQLIITHTLNSFWTMSVWRIPSEEWSGALHYDCQSVSQSVSQSVLLSSTILGSWPDNNYSLTVTVLSLCGALSDGRTDLSFVWVTVCSNAPFLIMYKIFIFYVIHVPNCIYVQGLCQPSLNTADYALFVVASVTTVV
jgi:hypothetical protein